MEQCEGYTLEDFIKGRKKSDRKQNYDIISQLLDGFASIHGMQIVHRNLKPSNILFKDGNCKIANLGFGESNETSQAAG